MVQRHRDLHSSIAGLPTGLASRGRTVTDSLVVNTKDVSAPDGDVTKWDFSSQYSNHPRSRQPFSLDPND